jgi:type VI secretion system protein ImpA
VYLCRALLHNEGFVGGVKGLALIEALLETFWDGLHPELDADDNDDPTMRLNALVPLGALEAVVGDLRASYVMRSRGVASSGSAISRSPRGVCPQGARAPPSPSPSWPA